MPEQKQIGSATKPILLPSFIFKFLRKKMSLLRDSNIQNVNTQAQSDHKFWLPVSVFALLCLGVFMYMKTSRPKYQLDVGDLTQKMVKGSPGDTSVFASYGGVQMVLLADVNSTCPFKGGRHYTQLGIDKVTLRDVYYKGCWTWKNNKIWTHTSEDAATDAYSIKDELVPEFKVNPYYLTHELPN